MHRKSSLSLAAVLLPTLSLPLAGQAINSFQSAVEIPSYVSGNPMALSGDFYNDGKQDLLSFGQNSQGGQVCVDSS